MTSPHDLHLILDETAWNHDGDPLARIEGVIGRRFEDSDPLEDLLLNNLLNLTASLGRDLGARCGVEVTPHSEVADQWSLLAFVIVASLFEMGVLDEPAVLAWT